MEANSTHLVIIIDAIPPGKLLEREEDLYEHWLDSVIAFANSHLLMSAKNSLTVIGSHLDNNQLIYPTSDVKSVSVDGQHELFATITEVISREMKKLATKAQQDIQRASSGQGKFPESKMACAVSLALCRINKLKSQFESSRIAVISASNESSSYYSSQYMNFMNTFFTAQKMNVVIDVCAASNQGGPEGGGSSILQQGCEITGGLYVTIPNINAFLEYLLWILLPDSKTRDKLILPPQQSHGFKAACFCHRAVVDVAFVCSVCLSIFCSFSPICSTCRTIFKLAALPTNKAKRKSQRK